MAVFEYIAYDAAGRRQRGLVEGSSARDARDRLRERQLQPARVRERDSPSAEGGLSHRWQRAASAWRRDRSADLALPLRELATLLKAGVPLAQALGALASQAEERGVEGVLRSLREGVLRGEPLSDAAGTHPRHFGPVTVNMLAAGEASGRLGAALMRVSDRLMLRRRIRGQVAGALVYPAILGVIGVAVVAFLLSYVVPRIAGIYLETGAMLPRPTRLLLAVSGVFADGWPWLLVGAIALVVGVRLALRTERAGMAWDGLKLRLPFVGAVYRRHCVAEFARTLSALLATGVPLVDALRLTAGTLKNRVAADEVRRVAGEVEVGSDASHALGAKGVFPRTVAEVMASGEESGELESLLETLAGEYERQVELTAERACRALEPLVVVLMGGAVLFIVMAVLLPIVRISEVVSF
jgi:general secretion pathway protein F